jgi:DNA-binding NtrC family response regulator
LLVLTPLKMKTILLVDDEPSLMALLAAVVEVMGHRVISASTCADAVALWKEIPCDLALIDYSLPDGSGAELAEKFLADKPATPILIMSGFSPTLLPIREDVRSKIGLVEKPFSVSALKGKIEAALKHK